MSFSAQDLIKNAMLGGRSGGGSSVQTDWNQTDETKADFLRNKPFGEETSYSETLSVTMTEAEIYVLIASGQTVADLFFKVSDSIVRMDDLQNGFSMTIGGETLNIPAEEVGDLASEVFDGIVMVYDGAFVSIDEQVVGLDIDGLVFPETGVYASVYFLLELKHIALTIPGFGFVTTVTKQIAGKYVERVFYVHGADSYLYMDSGFTVKATRADVASCAGSHISLCFGGLQYFTADGVDLQQEWAIIAWDDALIYTAEYVPETTT